MPKALVVFISFFTFVIFPATSFGASYAAVNVSLTADFPNDGQQQIVITNETGTNGCTADYQVCDNVALLNWTLNVAYTSSYYNGSGPALANPFVASWSGSGDNIVPAVNKTFDLDLCNGVAVSFCSAPTTRITSIIFSGSLSQSLLTIFDPSANGGNGGPGPTASVNPHFSLHLTPPASFPSGSFDSVSQDGNVTDGNINVLPEPGTALMLMSGVFIALVARRR